MQYVLSGYIANQLILCHRAAADALHGAVKPRAAITVGGLYLLFPGIKITMKSGVLFGFDSYTLTQASKDNLAKFAETLKSYDETNILVAGHTDNVGTESYNMKLSERRAGAVSNFLNSYGVKKARMSTIGYGESAPLAENTIESGRDQNRRVELAIVANEQLKKEANSGSNAVAKK